jgi:phage baseplate assembly protein W
MASNREYDSDPDVYIGVKLPIKFGNSGFWNKTSTTIEQAEYNLKNLLMTKFGERPAHPDLGCRLAHLNFEQLDDSIIVKAEEDITEAVSKWLPYLNIVKIEPTINHDASRLDVKITYTLKTDQSQAGKATVIYNQ